MESVATETTYRLIGIGEWERLRPVFAQYGSQLPDPSVSLIAAAELDGEIVGFLTLQPILHAEPLYIAPGHTGEVYVPRLLHLLEDSLRQVLTTLKTTEPVVIHVFSDKPETGRLAKAHGFEHAPYHVWRKQVSAEGGK